mmetsp:Transcript_14661/g.61878  ORF Transcript_14661/g.61878 Transcript_14661/m.61878 type:complete len:475 (+) Transcript_14661:1149-2573(+)
MKRGYNTRVVHRPYPDILTFSLESFTTTPARFAAVSNLFLVSPETSGLPSRRTVKPSRRRPGSPSKHSTSASAPSMPTSFPARFTSSSDGISASTSATAETPSSLNALPLRSSETSEAHPAIPSTSSHPPSPDIEFIARPKLRRRAMPGSASASATMALSPMPLLPRCNSSRCLHEGKAGASHRTPASERKHPRRSRHSRAGVPVGNASASSAAPPGPMSFPLMSRRARLGVLPCRQTAARSPRPSAVISLLERSSAVRETGSALATAQAPTSPMSHRESVKEVRPANAAGFRDNASAPASPRGLRASLTVSSLVQTASVSPSVAAAAASISSPSAEKDTSDDARFLRPGASDVHPSAPSQHSMSRMADILPSQLVPPSACPRALARGGVTAKGPVALTHTETDDAEPLAASASEDAAACPSRCSGEIWSSIAEECGTVTETGGSGIHFESSYPPRDKSSRLRRSNRHAPCGNA